ncbi:MAG: hypothetical protein ACE37J_00475, partial [Pikeienuella sp.]|uniref:hypothetical protein n=1 Tax=Pikeienuella sp. TaxID=2831957 RepID=UPI00391B6A8D
ESIANRSSIAICSLEDIAPEKNNAQKPRHKSPALQRRVQETPHTVRKIECCFAKAAWNRIPRLRYHAQARILPVK